MSRSSSAFTADAHVDGTDAVVVVTGDLDLATVPRLETALTDAFARDGELQRVVVDIAGVEFVDSSGLTALIKANRRAGEESLSFVLRSPSDRVRRTLQLTQLETVLAVE